TGGRRLGHAGQLCRWTHDVNPTQAFCNKALSDRYVSRLLRLAWLAPDVLERLVMRREPCAISLYDLCFVASLPWDEQPARVFD
ncbi:hypothetical protein LX81_01547, partial [Palleronia aestuarii]